jgi:hypothetical protein
MTRSYQPKAKFGPDEDSLLTAAVRELGTSNWSDIAMAVPGRSGRQCRERWNNYANPNLNKEQWTSSEDTLLLEKSEELGSKWSLIAGFFKRRAKNDVRNRIFALRRRSMQTPVYPPSCPTECPVSEKKIQESSDSAQVLFCWEAALDGDLMPLDRFF